MGLRINQNIAALRAVRGFRQAQEGLLRTTERLATGQQINRASDDPAGLIISENLRAQTAGLAEQIQGAETTAGRIRTEDARFGEVLDRLRGIRTRALDTLNAGASDPNVQAANQAVARGAVQFINRQLGQVAGDLGVETGGITSIAQRLADIDISTAEGAEAALGVVDEAIGEIATLRGELGARENALGAEASGQAVQRESLLATESEIRDADFAAEAVDLARQRIRAGASAAALARANRTQRDALGLIGGPGESRGGRISLFA